MFNFLSPFKIFFFVFIYLLTTLGLHCSVHLSLVSASGGYSKLCGKGAAHCSGFSCYIAKALEHVGFSNCGAWA